MQDRITQLESLVRTLMNNTIATRPTDQIARDPAQLSDDFGRISLENTETSYVESAHWTAILDGIAELKDHLEGNDKSPDRTCSGHIEDPVLDADAPDLLFGNSKQVSRQEILAAIPQRSMVDRLLALYFSGMDMTPVYIHGPTFLKQYEQFWTRPFDTSLIWLGMLFAIMCTGAWYQQIVSPEIDPQAAVVAWRAIQTYKEKVSQCLVLGKYTKCAPYTIETLMLYSQLEAYQSQDTMVGTWVLYGIIVRLALRMGYHRDPSHSSRITPFQAEMRRRTWMQVFLFDVMAGAQIGLPRMIREWQADTAEPRNLRDEDFGEDTVRLPPSRPDTEHTNVQFFLAKYRLISIFGMINDLTTSTRASSYAEVMKLDKMLHDYLQAMPLPLRMRTMTESIMDNHNIIVRRIFMLLSFCRAQIVLHRKHLLLARTDGRYTYSSTTCIDAALRILELQCTLDQETQFALAVTILCLQLSYELDEELSRGTDRLEPDSSRQKRIIEILIKTYPIWLQLSKSSKEAHKLTEALKVVLGKAREMKAQNSTVALPNISTANSDSNCSLGTPSAESSMEQNVGLGTLDSTDTPMGMPLSLGFTGPLTATVDTMADFTQAADFNIENWDPGYDISSIDGLLPMPYPDIFEFPP
ncbi:hypothetical protein H2203_006864 [Taxawa tesnikishii (nom. ined.)]|nr:hypothetical protein H2203_006864 [Dothideales sp. JES 119]